MRFDIGWRDLLAGLSYCVLPVQQRNAAIQTARAWNSRDDFLVTLSVRSGFDLLLRAMALPHGSEVLLSALTVPDMVRIVQSHGLIPVPLDVDRFGNVSKRSFQSSLSPKSRLLVVAHLFGGRSGMDEVVAIARENELLVVEDCAQGFRETGDTGHMACDVAMFSFGPIKTATALGGAVIRVSSTKLRDRMASILESDPVQSRFRYFRRVIRFALLKLLSGRRTSTMLRRVIEVAGFDFDSLLNSSARGFGSSELLPQLRRQPSVALLRLLERRWRLYDFGRIKRRMRMGRYFDDRIGNKHDRSHTYWVYPLFVENPIELRNQLRAIGFDATCQSRMAVVPAGDGSEPAESTIGWWKHVLFLPWYVELTDEALIQLADSLGFVEQTDELVLSSKDVDSWQATV